MKFGKGKENINYSRSRSIFEKINSTPSPTIIRNRIDLNSPDFKNEFKSKNIYFTYFLINIYYFFIISYFIFRDKISWKFKSTSS